MTTLEFVSHLRALGVQLWTEDNRLRVNAPEGVLTPELRAELARRKAELIAFLRQAGDAVQATEPTIHPAPRGSGLPLSSSQQRLWLLDQLEPNNVAYNIPATARLSGRLDVLALEASINEIVQRHETLRTTFASANERVVQVIAPALRIPLPVLDLGHLSEAEREATARQLAAEEARVPFDLARGPLVRATLLRMGAEEHVLLLTLHHIVSDDWSLRVFIGEMAALYQAFVAGKPSPLPDLPIQYADFAAWQQGWLQGDALQVQLAYWKEQLSGVAALPDLPTDRPRPRVQTYRGERRFVVLPKDQAEGLGALSRQEGGTLFMTLLAAFAVSLHHYTGQDDVVVGSPIAGRTRREVEGLIGFFVNTVVLRTDLAGDPTFRGLLGRVREVTASAYAHQDVPFEQVVQALQPERDPSRTPLFQAFFNNMFSTAAQAIEIPGMRIAPFSEFIVGAPNVGAKFDLTLVAVEHREGIQLDISFNADLFEARTVEWLLEHLQTLLASVAADPDRRLSELPRLTATGRNLVGPTNAFVPLAKEEIEQSLAARFEKQVVRCPDRIAVEADGEALSYGTLNRSANRLARVIGERYDDRFKLSRRERIRYTRQLLLSGWGVESQEILKRTTVFAAGAGGSGSPTIMQLALCGVGTIVVCDFDEVELSNLNRQFLHDESRIGMNKALSAQMTIERVNPHVNVVARTERITRDNVHELVGGASIIFDNLDDLEAKFVLSEYAVARRIPHIISSMIERSAYAAILHSPHTPCFHCLYDRSKLDEIREMERLIENRQRVPNSVASPALFLSTGFACNEALKIILGLENPAYNHYFLFNQTGSKDIVNTDGFRIVTYPFSEHFKALCKEQGFDWEEGWSGRLVEDIVLEKDPACPVCGAARPEESKVVSVENVAFASTGQEQTVALLLGHAAPMVVGILGVLKAGKIYVTLDPAYPEGRLVSMLEDSEARLIVTDDDNMALAERIRDRVNKHVRIVSLTEIDGNVSAENLATYARPDQIAYIVYTSGSTGRPKGVMQSHRNALHFTMNYTNGLHIGEEDRLSLIPSFTFSAAMMDTFAALLNGATLCLFDVRREGVAGMGDWLIDNGITVYHSVPTVFRHFAATITEDLAFPRLRLIDLGGEPVSRMDVELYKRHFAPGCILVNGLGATELNVIRQYYMDKRSVLVGGNVPAGYAVEDTEILLLDEAGRAAGFNRAGEIVIKSRYLAPGYWLQPEQTVATFKPVPQTEGKRLYYTGDLGRMRADGCLEHLGRKDAQVKIRGVRIEPAEIEVALLEMDRVKEAVVVAREDQAGAKYLAAYVVPQPGEQKLPIGALRRSLREKLPTYMIPSEFVMLEALPLTPTGKVDRRALPTPAAVGPSSSVGYVPPRTPVEEVLADIWAELLRLERVGIYDDFFDLGGHSLLATQVLSRVRSITQVELSLQTLFEASTIAELAKRVEAACQSEQASSAPPITPMTCDAELPLSFAQQRLWFLHQLEPDSAAYNISNATHISGLLDVAGIEQSIAVIVQRHETLRTTFATVEGRAAQRIAPALTLPLPVVDLGELPQAQQAAEVQRLAVAEARRPFDLVAGPLVRVTLLRMKEDEHVLLLTMHHIISDGWSMGVFVRELASVGRAYIAGLTSPLPELPIQYADFALWQREWLQGEVLERQLTYWKRQLAGVPAVLDLPTDHPRPAIQTYRGSTRVFHVPTSTVESLRSLSQQEGTTLFMTLLAAFNVLLCRYTGQEDVVVGSPIANRNRSETERLIGFFVNTLALRTDLSGNPTFRQLLARVREVTLAAYDHQDLPFEMLVDELQLVRDLSRNPIFQVMFILQNAPSATPEIPGLTFRALDIDPGAVQFDLTLTAFETKQGLRGVWEYSSDLFRTGTIAQMTDHICHLLDEVVANPDRRISDLPLLTEVERQVLMAWNAAETDDVQKRQERCVHEMIETQVLATPDAVAVVFDDQHVSYRELERRANQLARYLRRSGVRPETLVGICMVRSPEMIVGVLGILKAGGAYVPFDPAYPKERLVLMMEEARLAVLLTQERLLDSLPEAGTRVICLDTGWGNIARGSGKSVATNVAADNLVYVIYTSGSTGVPKGVAVQHRSLMNYVLGAVSEWGLCRDDRVLQFASISWDTSAEEIFPCLASGATLVLRTDSMLDSYTDFLHRCGDWALSILDLPTAYWRDLTAAMGEYDLEISPSVRVVIVGGEEVQEETVVAWQKRVSRGVWLANTYGLTEATAVTTVCRLSGQVDGSIFSRRVPIGRPMRNVRTCVLDRYLNLVPVGLPGELYIGGGGLARGYLRRAGLTAERFVPDRFASEPGSRLYRTGDLARYLPDGNLEFLGRIDQQVKVRGFRIELGEIEAALGQHPAVREVAVVAREDAPGLKRLAAYLVTDEGQELAGHELREFLKRRLPDYMLPSAFVRLETLPLTPNGKVDRRALPAPEGDRLELEAIYVAPRTPVEEMLANIWADVLRLERVGMHDNFFDLGGDSLLALQVINKASTTGLWFVPRQLFEHQTIAELAAVENTIVSQTEQETVTGPVPLLPNQRWFFDLDLVEPHRFNVADLFEIEETLIPSLVERVVRELLTHHDALRARFVREASGWRQFIVAPDEVAPFSLVDLSALPESEHLSAIEAAADALQASLNLAGGPVVRIALFDLGARRSGRLLTIIHHLVTDGFSQKTLFEDFTTAYQQLSRGEAIRLPAKTTSLKHWAKRLEDYARSTILRQELAYWSAYAGRIPDVPQPDYPDGVNLHTSLGLYPVDASLCAEETHILLQKVLKIYNVQLVEVLLTAIAEAFARLTGNRAVYVDLLYHGREMPMANLDVSRTMGWFVIHYPVLLDLAGTSDVVSALQMAKEQFNRVPNRGVGYDLLRYMSGDEAIVQALPPRPKIAFSYDFTPVGPTSSTQDYLPIKPARESTGYNVSRRGTWPYLFELRARTVADRLDWVWKCNANRYRRSMNEELNRGFMETLQFLIGSVSGLEEGVLGF
jgi:amino acid adenylation domain-containing protein/non-ribosomal peptide synthase protein (TIGR01720 family)